jgi:hypothetical protein
MLKEVVGFYSYVPKFYADMFRHMVVILRGRECLISYSGNVLCYGRVRIMPRPVWPVVVECVQVYIGDSDPAVTFRQQPNSHRRNVLIKIH